ncbi:prolipoprotein diacylglyceryl transferase [mine drainage metagenome]|uniref:Prolipoprotein diacylglyceryl transferase n=1 Tax=mine drainage metagenome TaxID=410659 RepID=A0A1J5TDB9_9ZZZZ
MLVHPQFDPVAIHLGPFGIHWYGLMYLLGFVCFIWLGRKRLRTLDRPGWDEKFLDDMLFYGVLGVVLGGRLGEVLFYNPGYYFSHPLKIFAVWEGGMSFHGGFLGVLAAMVLFARNRNIRWLALMDFIAPLVPPGLAFGRLGNFINGELWGRPTDVPWGMWFPNADKEPLSRHPSQLYEFALEGVALFALLWWFSRKPRPTGAVSGLFLIGYGGFRSICEFTRNPDDGIFGLMTFGISMGQWLSLPMVIAGIAMMVWAHRRASR